MQEIGDAKPDREGEPCVPGALVAEPPVGARAFDHGVGAAHQRLHDGGGGRPGGERLHDEGPLLVAKRNQGHRDLLVLGQRNSAHRPAFGSLLHPHFVRGKRALRSLLLERVVLRGLADQGDGVGVGDFQHPVAQHLVGRRQSVQSEGADDEAQGAAVDQQGEKHEAGRQNCDELPDRGGHAGNSGHGQGEHQRQRPAQAAPGDGDLVGGADRLHQPGDAQERQEEK